MKTFKINIEESCMHISHNKHFTKGKDPLLGYKSRKELARTS